MVMKPSKVLLKIFHKIVKKFQNCYCIFKMTCYNVITNSKKHLGGTYYEEDSEEQKRFYTR